MASAADACEKIERVARRNKETMLTKRSERRRLTGLICCWSALFSRAFEPESNFVPLNLIGGAYQIGDDAFFTRTDA